VKKIRFLSNVPAEVCAIPQPIALDILKALHRFIETGHGKVKALFDDGEYLVLQVHLAHVGRDGPRQSLDCSTGEQSHPG
jgi:hypothetical protein